MIAVFFITLFAFVLTSIALLQSQDSSAPIIASSSDQVASDTTVPVASDTQLDTSEQNSVTTQVLAQPTPETSTTNQTTTTEAVETFINFSPNEFRDLFDTSELSGLNDRGFPRAITGNNSADTHIRSLATTRGYELQPAPDETLGTVDGFRLQPRALVAWQDMVSAATNDGVDLRLISGLRLPEIQQELFVDRLVEVTTDFDQISSGSFDSEIEEILDTLAIPGYSKHHTGYAIDIASETNNLSDFENTEGYDWISTNNFENAKEYGFIPSYPEGADSQGPLPEPWEYVWVGRDKLVN